MSKRVSKGATLAMSAVLIVVIVLVGVAIFGLIEMFGGYRELSNATDSGVLNIAKQVQVNPGIQLNGAQEISTFGDLVDTNGMITLRTVNQVVGRALLIGLEAKASGTPAAMQHANMVLGLAQTNQNSICARLYAALTPQSTGQQAFMNTAGANSLRMLGDKGMNYVMGNYQTAYMNAGDASNVYFPASLPQNVLSALPASAFSKQKSDSGQLFLVGYQPITIAVGSNQLTYYFVPLAPGGQPHLVSQRDFAASTTSPLPGFIPPNGFQTGSSTQNNVAGASTTIASALTSCLQYQAQLDFPHGYLTVTNPPGIKGLTDIASFTNSLFTNELAAGIFISTDKNGNPLAFSTDKSAMTAWANYNSNPTGPQPPLSDKNGNPLMFDAQGNPATVSEVKQITTASSPSTGCNTLNVGGNPPASTLCNQMLGSFENAYPHAAQTEPGNPADVMAVEYWGQQVFAAGGQLVNSLVTAGVWNQTSDDSPTTNCCVTVTPTSTETGLLLFDRYPGPKTNYPVNPYTMTNINMTDIGFNSFPTPGTPVQLANQVNATTYPTDLRPPLVAAIRLIKPEATDAEIDAMLNSQTLLLGSIDYIYMSDQKARTLVLSNTPPPVKSTTPSDGLMETISSGQYETVGYTVDNWFKASSGYYNIAFQLPLNPDTTGLATDKATFTGNTGYLNYLGNLEFYNSVEGSGTMCGPN